ncbi:MAG: hypothetical protein NTZ64_00950 [Polaromonas sp.]|nr:hypothetical protein [Polaromonas sp.]
MGREALRAYLKSRQAAATSATSEKSMTLQEKPLQIKAVTSATSATSINTNSREVFQPLPQPGALKPASSEQRDPNDWRELATAYHLHHFACHVCIAASKGAMYGLRCGAGAALWVAYQNAP